MCDRPDMFTQEFWDGRYGRHGRVWSGRTNQQLVAVAGGLTPGRALDMGCGEGADAIWLAQRGWTVTGADISPVGLKRAADNAASEAPDVAGVIEWRQADLFGDTWEMPGGFDLVNSQYLHLPPAFRERAVNRLAAAVRPAGHLLVVSHHPDELKVPGLRPNVPELFHTAPELADHLDRHEWEIVAAGEVRRSVQRNGETVTATDAVLHARRRATTRPPD